MDVLSRPVGATGRRPMTRKRVEFAGLSSMRPAQDRHAVHLRRDVGGDGGHRRVVARPLHRRRGGRGLLGDRLRQMGREPVAALGEPLGMRAHQLHLAELDGPRDEVLRDVERHLAGDRHVGVDEPVERHVDRAVGRVLHRDHAELGPAALDLVEDLRDRAHRQELRRGAEAADRRLVGEGARAGRGTRPASGCSRASEAERISRQMARIASPASGPPVSPTRRSRTWASRSGM